MAMRSRGHSEKYVPRKTKKKTHTKRTILIMGIIFGVVLTLGFQYTIKEVKNKVSIQITLN